MIYKNTMPKENQSISEEFREKFFPIKGKENWWRKDFKSGPEITLAIELLKSTETFWESKISQAIAEDRRWLMEKVEKIKTAGHDECNEDFKSQVLSPLDR